MPLDPNPKHTLCYDVQSPEDWPSKPPDRGPLSHTLGLHLTCMLKPSCLELCRTLRAGGNLHTTLRPLPPSETPSHHKPGASRRPAYLPHLGPWGDCLSSSSLGLPCPETLTLSLGWVFRPPYPEAWPQAFLVRKPDLHRRTLTATQEKLEPFGHVKNI